MDAKEIEKKIADTKRREREELADTRRIVSNAIIELFTSFNYTFGKIKKIKKDRYPKYYLELIVKTGLDNKNEESVERFNNTKIRGGEAIETFLSYSPDMPADPYNPEGSDDNEDEYEWVIPLTLVDDGIIKAEI